MKITIVGGGSYTWTFGFVRQFVRSERLKDVHLVLQDIDAERLELVGALCERYNAKRGSPLTIEKTLELAPALDEADYVIVSISTGGLKTMRVDLEVPEKYGIRHTVGDTVGPGGWNRAVRNVPVFYNLAEAMKRNCPNAWMLNCSNPLSVLTRVPDHCFGIRTVGMCPGVEDQAKAYVRLIGKDPAKARIDLVNTGIDHGAFFTALYADGVDVIARLKELGFHRSDDRIPSQVELEDGMVARVHSRAIFAIWRETGYLPSLSDRHIVENFPQFLTVADATLPFAIVRTFIREREERYAKARAKIEAILRGDGGDQESLGHGDDPILDVIESLAGHRDFLWTSNYKNIGQIPEAPLCSVVETRCRVDAAGVHPLCSPMPPVLQPYIMPHILRQNACVDIALNGDFDQFVALVMSDPLCCRLKMGECRAMVKEMLLGTKGYIRNPKLLEF